VCSPKRGISTKRAARSLEPPFRCSETVYGGSIVVADTQ
jgi:hypothetical protein